MGDKESRLSLAIQNRENIIQNTYAFTDESCVILQDQVKRGEYYTFQVPIKSNEDNIEDVHIDITHLIGKPYILDKKNIICFNKEKVDYQGNPYIEKINLEANKLKVLWFGIKIPENQEIGIYIGKISLRKDEIDLGSVQINLDVQEEMAVNQGLEDLKRQSRLFWMNSKKGIDHQVTKGYLPIQVKNNTLQILGRTIQLADSGLPEQIISYYNDQVELVDEATKLLSKPIDFRIEMQGAKCLAFNQKYKIDNVKADRVTWSNELENEEIIVTLKGTLEYEGWMHYTINLKSKKKIILKDTKLIISYQKEIAKYMMGLGHKGRKLPQEDEWKWDQKKHQDEVWIGNVEGGIKCQLKDDTYTAPLVNVYFNQSYLKSPKAWHNQGKGGVSLKQNQEEASLKIYTQDYVLEEDEERRFEFEYLITPLKPIDYKKNWQTRYYHPNENNKVGDEWIEQTKQEACNYTIVHHGQKAHPFINYPFIEVEELKSLVDQAHTEDIKLKIYYTIREMSNHAAEFWPWYHLGLYPKASQNEPVFWENIKELWTQKVFGREVIPAWEHEFQEGKYKGDICSAVIVKPHSTLDNYYIEGLDWLVKEMGIDGIYIDDTSIGRDTLRRARKVLDQKEGSLIDMHSWNHMNKHAGYANSALIYMNLFPYIDSLWYGEGFDYDESPEYWLIEMTGIPYGLMGQMLQGGGNPYRGMLYGMTNRTGWGAESAKALYELWDSFGIEDATMYGYWTKECPVTTNNEKVLATVYQKQDKLLIVVASWSDQMEEVELKINWSKIKLREDKVRVTVPDIAGIQDGERSIVLGQLSVSPKKGCFIIIEKERKIYG